jgi:hypothetical protein
VTVTQVALDETCDQDLIDEKAALAQQEGGVPALYARSFAVLQVVRPGQVDDARWQQVIDDAGRFLDQWGTQAKALGWSPADLFGSKALTADLHGRPVCRMTAGAAFLVDGAVFNRDES